MDNAATWRLLKERALESTAEGVVIADCSKHDMPLIYVNNAFTEMTGYSYDEVVGKNCRFLQGPDTDTAAAGKIRKSISAEQPCKIEILNQQGIAKPFSYMFTLNNDIAKARPGRNVNFKITALLLAFLGEQRLI